MLPVLALLLTTFQGLEVAPRVAHPGDPIRVQARNAAGQPLPGITVRVRVPSGEVRVVGAADHRGEVGFVPEQTGVHEFRARFPGGPVCIAVYDVVPRPRRWLYALFLTPLGLWIVWFHLVRLRAPSGAAGDDPPDPAAGS